MTNSYPILMTLEQLNDIIDCVCCAIDEFNNVEDRVLVMWLEQEKRDIIKQFGGEKT